MPDFLYVLQVTKIEASVSLQKEIIKFKFLKRKKDKHFKLIKLIKTISITHLKFSHFTHYMFVIK